jgi:hypothetical protein
LQCVAMASRRTSIPSIVATSDKAVTLFFFPSVFQ